MIEKSIIIHITRIALVFLATATVSGSMPAAYHWSLVQGQALDSDSVVDYMAGFGLATLFGLAAVGFMGNRLVLPRMGAFLGIRHRTVSGAPVEQTAPNVQVDKLSHVTVEPAKPLHKRAQPQATAAAQVEAKNRAVRLLSACNQTLIHATVEETLLRQICQLAVTVGGYTLAWIGLADDTSEHRLLPTVIAGADNGYLQEISCCWADTADADNCLVTAQDRVLLVRVPADARAAPTWLRVAAQRGCREIATFPLVHKTRRLGVLAIYAATPNAFEAPEIGLLQEMADDLAFGIATLRNLAEQRRLQEETAQLAAMLQQAQRMESIGLLAGGIAHDFNNLLVPILAYAELGSMAAPPNTPERDRFEKILAAAEYARALTKRILAISRRQGLQVATVNPNEIVSDLNKVLSRVIREDIAVNMALAPDVAAINADRTQIEQIILNLAVNARDAMPNGGKLTFETANVELDATYAASQRDVEPGSYVMLAVSDTGYGMDAATLARIFEPFFTTKQEGQGTGLGLATVCTVVRQHRGHIRVYSEPGIGTTFKIYFPVASTTIQPTRQAGDADLRPHGEETILLVEDDDQVRQAAANILTAYGYTVWVARNPDEALEIAQHRHAPLDLLLTDVIMPHLNGRELYTRLRALLPDLRVLYMSGYTSNAIVHPGVVDADTFLLQKPFCVAALLQGVRLALAAEANQDGAHLPAAQP